MPLTLTHALFLRLSCMPNHPALLRFSVLLQGLSSAARWHALLFCRPTISISFTGDGCCLVSWPSNRFILDSGLEVLQPSLIVLRPAKTNRFESLWNQLALFDFVALHSHCFFFLKTVAYSLKKNKFYLPSFRIVATCWTVIIFCLLVSFAPAPSPPGSAASKPPLDVVSLS